MSGGSLANLESLWAVRDIIKNGMVYFSEVSHYSWKRICKILNINKFKEIRVDNFFRMDLNQLEAELKKNRGMIVIANLGSTGTGSIDDIEEIISLKKKYDFHLHIDAAYGGFIRSVLIDDENKLKTFNKDFNVSKFVYQQLKSLQYSDSITIDPHKHGLIPYGAGAVLFKDRKFQQAILNTAPYTYHKIDKPNIGMFSLEGSRPGAIAAACYLTFKVIPLKQNGLGKVINQSLKSSQKFFELIGKNKKYKNLNYPDLDINCFYKNSKTKSISELNKQTLNAYNKLSIESKNPEFILSKFILRPELAKRILPDYINSNNENFTSLRAVFVKHWMAMNDFYYVKKLIEKLESI